jgi:hypothetical protein
VLKNFLRTTGKISYCIMDTNPLPGTAGSPRHLSWIPLQQRPSIGWAETYERHLPGKRRILIRSPLFSSRACTLQVVNLDVLRE